MTKKQHFGFWDSFGAVMKIMSLETLLTVFHLYPFSYIGVVQGMITGIRGLCNGLGPALYGFVFYLFHVELTDTDGSEKGAKPNMANPTDEVSMNNKLCASQ